MWRVKHNKVELAIWKRKISERTLNIRINNKMSVFLFAIFIQCLSKVAFPLFFANIAVCRVRFVFLEPDGPVATCGV